jgi:hypothetical protein
MNRWTCRSFASLILAGMLATPALAALDVDFGAKVSLDDRTDLFFAVSSRYFEEDRTVVKRLGLRYTDPDDLAVALFIAKRSGHSDDAVWNLRRQGLSWWEISVRFGVPVNAWFVEVQRDPGPPYGKAYGYWKKHKKDRRAAVALTDDDCRHLVTVRMVHEYYGVSIETAMEWRSSGRDVRMIVSDEYQRRYGKAKGYAVRTEGKSDSKHPGKGHGKKH